MGKFFNNANSRLSSSMLISSAQQQLQPLLQQHCMQQPMHQTEHNPSFPNQNPFDDFVFLNNLNAISNPAKIINQMS